MTTGIESGTGGLWAANQAALGTIAATSATSTLKLRKASDDTLKSNKTHGNESYVDGSSFDNATPYVTSVGGDVGQFVIQSQIETGAAIWARQIGVDVVTGGSDPWTHTITTGTANPVYQTIREKTGVAVGPYRAAWWDSILNKIDWNCGQGQFPGHLTCGVQALKAAEIGSLTDPVAVDSGTDPWRWGEAAGAMTIAAVAFPEISGEVISLDRGWTTHMGDNIEPAFFVPGEGPFVRTLDGAVTDTMLPQLLLALYGATTPSIGNRPTTQPTFVALKSVYTRSASRTLSHDTPRVEVKPDDITIGTKPVGGLWPITFGGRVLSTASPHMTIIAKTGDSTSYIT